MDLEVVITEAVVLATFTTYNQIIRSYLLWRSLGQSHVKLSLSQFPKGWVSI